MSRQPSGPARGARDLAVRVRAKKGRSTSSARWLTRQLNDPYVVAARREGYRSRAAFKLIELDDRFRFLKPGALVVDLGAAPGGWTQIAIQRVRAGKPGGGRVLAVDVLPMDTFPEAETVVADALEAAVDILVDTRFPDGADVVLSDMAAPTTGHSATDHLRIVGLAEAAMAVAERVLRPGGTFVCKMFQGGTEGALLARLKRRFTTVRHAKPAASRAESAETYLVATGFRPAEAPPGRG